MALYLASTSPRRHQLLNDCGFQFEILKPGSDEIEAPGESPRAMVERFATEKALSSLDVLPASARIGVIITADTTVVSPDRKKILNKPNSPEVARKMLRTLSGKTHTVLTGFVICAFDAGKITRWHQEVVKTSVTLRKLTPAEVAAYVSSGEPLDKAGAYAAQGIGMCLIEAIRGSYSNVVGLPMTELTQALEKKFKVVPNWKR
ncbi:MAG: septum formation protein Maf [Cryobacterium sp.]|nr:septum formation protein Maf [Oligoflexia bacterium]